MARSLWRLAESEMALNEGVLSVVIDGIAMGLDQDACCLTFHSSMQHQSPTYKSKHQPIQTWQSVTYSSLEA